MKATNMRHSETPHAPQKSKLHNSDLLIISGCHSWQIDSLLYAVVGTPAGKKGAGVPDNCRIAFLWTLAQRIGGCNPNGVKVCRCSTADLDLNLGAPVPYMSSLMAKSWPGHYDVINGPETADAWNVHQSRGNGGQHESMWDTIPIYYPPQACAPVSCTDRRG